MLQHILENNVLMSLYCHENNLHKDFFKRFYVLVSLKNEFFQGTLHFNLISDFVFSNQIQFSLITFIQQFIRQKHFGL